MLSEPRLLPNTEPVDWPAPPEESESYYGAKWERLLREKEKDFVFAPEWFDLDCDPRSCAEIEKGFTGLRKIAGGQSAIPVSLKKVFDEQWKEWNDDRKENPFGGFRRAYRDDRTYWQATLKRAGSEDHVIGIKFDDWEYKEVSYSGTFYAQASPYRAPIFNYNAEAVRKSGASPYDLELRDDADSRWYGVKGVTGDQSETDAARRRALIREAFEIHQAEVGHIPLHQQALAWAMKPGIDLPQPADNAMRYHWAVLK